MRVIVTDQAMRMIEARAIFPFKQTATRRPDGQWLLNLDQDNYERLAGIQHPEESISDVIVRLCSTAGRALQ